MESDDRDTARRLVGTRFSTVHWFEEIDSTNRYLADLAAQRPPSERSGVVAVADRQTAGHGRHDRRWEAPARSSMLASVLVVAEVDVEVRPLLLGAAALAGAQAVEALCGLSVELKWPNDLLVGGRKLGGLLAEVIDAATVVGCGINLSWERFPPDLAETATAVNLAGGTVVSVDALLVSWLVGFEREIAALEAGRAADLVERMSSRMATLGRVVRIDRVDGSIRGTAQHLDSGGRLVIVDESGELRTVAEGDVVHLR